MPLQEEDLIPVIETFEETVHLYATEVAALVIKKQQAYGKDNILQSPAGVETGIVVRIYDKLSRIINLTANGRNPDWETVEDTWADIVGYGLIGLMVQRDTFSRPLGKISHSDDARVIL